MEKAVRSGYVITGAALILFIFLFQQQLFTVPNPVEGREWTWFFQKSARFLVNDFAVILMIYGLFYEKKYLKLGFYVQVFELLFLLTPYLVIKLQFPFYNGPLISHLHRLVVNPLLMLMLIPIIYYQKTHVNK